MELQMSHLHKIFKDTLDTYSRKVIPIPTILMVLVEKDKYLADAKANPLNQLLISNGLIKDFESEYPGFMVVYADDKSPMSFVFRGHYRISICYELAKERLKPFTTQQAYSYLKHGFAHEITHIIENKVRLHLFKAGGSLPINGSIETKMLDSESYAEQIADMVEDGKQYQYVEQKLWEFIKKRAMNLKGGHKEHGME